MSQQEPDPTQPGGDPATLAAGPAPAAAQPSRRRIILILGIVGVLVAAGAASAIALGSTSQGPRYAVPRDVCALITASDLAKYLPGTSTNPLTPSPAPTAVGQGGQHLCMWSAAEGDLTVGAVVYDSPADGPAAAQRAFNLLVVLDDKDTTARGARTAITGVRAVAGLGAQAIAVLRTVTVAGAGNYVSDWVDLFVRSGNALILIQFSIPIPSARQLPGAIAVARDVLAALPRS